VNETHKLHKSVYMSPEGKLEAAGLQKLYRP